ncbi:hypothetical protein F441_22725 [Phytophthora nicotianae CJ01A1]|uniref:Uncharacterized protein n=2 Tax=Phytophthora nicotianae TaxID=4792 RepID=W2VQC0_PHYNI|nr:hypothetical protein F441_22725 [Phytophthora nicotianae CJ01A1]
MVVPPSLRSPRNIHQTFDEVPLFISPQIAAEDMFSVVLYGRLALSSWPRQWCFVGLSRVISCRER